MSVWTVLAVALGGGAGAALRSLVDTAVTARLGTRFPWGIVLVNLTGSLALGLVTGAASHALPADWGLVLGTGLLGGYTTFSTASLDTVRLALDRRAWAALLHGFGTIVGCVALAAIGFVAAA